MDEVSVGNQSADSLITPIPLALSDVKAKMIGALSDTDPTEIMTAYSEGTHQWFALFSENALSREYPNTWDAVSVDFVLLCFAVVLLNLAPQESNGAYILDSETWSMYLTSKASIALLEAAGQPSLNSIDFVKARLAVTIFEVSHGLYPSAYLSIAAAVRAADALVTFPRQGTSQPIAETDPEEYRIMWCGIAIIDRYSTQNGLASSWPLVDPSK
jgi:hypothetical protein